MHGPTPEIGVVFQDANLMPWRTVLANVMLPGQVLRLDRKACEARARELLALVGLVGFEAKLPGELSGGMRQRAAIARALLHDPRILLMDEPFGALDAMTRDNMNVELARIAAEAGKTVFLITHSIAESVFLSDRVLVMSSRPGRIIETIPIDLPRPRSLDVVADPLFAATVLRIRRLLEHSDGRRSARDLGALTMTTQEHLATRDAPAVPSRLFRRRPLPDLALTALLVVGAIAACQAPSLSASSAASWSPCRRACCRPSPSS